MTGCHNLKRAKFFQPVNTSGIHTAIPIASYRHWALHSHTMMSKKVLPFFLLYPAFFPFLPLPIVLAPLAQQKIEVSEWILSWNQWIIHSLHLLLTDKRGLYHCPHTEWTQKTSKPSRQWGLCSIRLGRVSSFAPPTKLAFIQSGLCIFICIHTYICAYKHDHICISTYIPNFLPRNVWQIEMTLWLGRSTHKQDGVKNFFSSMLGYRLLLTCSGSNNSRCS